MEKVFAAVEKAYGSKACALVKKAHEFMCTAHKGVLRIEGGPYATHPEHVAMLLVEMGYTDPELIVGALLHDTVEDTAITLADIRNEFGETICFLVNAVTDVGEGDGAAHIPDKMERKIPTHEKVLSAGKQDARVYLIKLADRIHNLQTKEVLSPKRQERMITEARTFHRELAQKIGDKRLIQMLDELVQ